MVSDRYQTRPRTTDAVRTPTAGTPVRNSGVKIRDRGTNVPVRSAVVVPRANPMPATGGYAAPRLNPRSSSITSGVRAYGSTWRHGNGSYYNSRHCNTWGVWWWPQTSHWSLHSHYCNVSLWMPWYWANTYWWDNCYTSTWSYRWSRPYSVSTNYWWYPASSYCPTYYFVPSLYSSNGYVPVENVAEPISTEISYADSVPAAGGAGRRDLPPESLAKKYVELGDFYFAGGRFTEALDAYNRARGYAPQDASVHFLAADAAFATGDYPYAAYLITEAVRLDPAIVGADTDKRLYYGSPKSFEDQMAQLDTYLTDKPYDAQAQLVRAYNLRFSDRPTAALAAFRRVLEIAPDNRTAQAFVSALAPAGAEPTDR